MSVNLEDRRARVARAFTEAIPHARRLGMRLVEVADGRAVLEMPQSPELVGDPETGVIHGGVIFTLMDTCGGAAVLCHETMALSTATLDLRIDYMRSAKPGQMLRAEAVCYHVTRSVAFVRATAWDEDMDKPMAMATGAFTVVRQ